MAIAPDSFAGRAIELRFSESSSRVRGMLHYRLIGVEREGERGGEIQPGGYLVTGIRQRPSRYVRELKREVNSHKQLIGTERDRDIGIPCIPYHRDILCRLGSYCPPDTNIVLCYTVCYSVYLLGLITLCLDCGQILMHNSYAMNGGKECVCVR